MLMLAYRAAIFAGSFCIVLGILFVPPGGYLAEVMFLEQSPGKKILSRAMSLCGNGGFGWFLINAIILALFWMLCSIGVLLAIDLILTLLFSTPILFQRVVSSPDVGYAMSNLIMSDPRSATAFHAAVWIPFPVIRIAWFLCYLDHRIRSECWDLEVKFRAEAIKLSESGQPIHPSIRRSNCLGKGVSMIDSNFVLRSLLLAGLTGTLVFCFCANAATVSCCAGCLQEQIDPDRIRAEINQVMEDRDFRAVRNRVKTEDSEQTFLDRWLENIERDSNESGAGSTGSRNNSSSGSEVAGAFSRMFLILIIPGIFAVLALIVFIIARTVDFSSGKSTSRPLATTSGNPLALSAPPGELAVNEYERRALSMAAEGDYGGAIRELLLGSMSWIERKGLIRFRAGLTNRDYLRAVWRLQSQRTAFDNNALEFDKIYFGRRTATQSVFQSCLNHFRGAFHDDSVVANSTL